MPTDYRIALQELMKTTVEDQALHRNWFYEFVRPQKVQIKYTRGLRVGSDCSDGCRILAYSVGLPDDPAGNAYQDWGNSSYIWTHLRHAPLVDVEVGDMFTFGYGTGEKHVCMAYDVTDKHNPRVWNMGTQGQPVFRNLSEEIAGHRGMTVTLCKLNVPAPPPPTPQEKLCAETGFYAWVAWRLGEGDWKNYGAANKNVRPNVKKRVPVKWWKDYTLFLARRKKGNKATSK